MIPDELIPELAYFRQFETQIPFSENIALDNLVIAGDNECVPVHRWYRFKEGFSHLLLDTLLTNGMLKGLPTDFSLLDPFCGSGTSLLSSQNLVNKGFTVKATGIERNPFIHFVAKTKSNWSFVDESMLSDIWEQLSQHKAAPSELPALSSISTGRCISRYMASRVVRAVEIIKSSGCTATHDAALLAVASAIEPVSKVRKDGRALRLRKRDWVLFDDVLRRKWELISGDCAQMRKEHSSSVQRPTLVLGDGRAPAKYGVAAESIDLILTSPPYPNNIDYSEVYKLELWLLGFVNSEKEFYQLRRSTLRSHPCIGPAGHNNFDEEEFPNILKRVLTHVKQQESWRVRMLKGYFSDMRNALSAHYDVLRKGGYEVLVIGNSLHGGSTNPLLIPTDLVLADLAQQVGFRVCAVLGTRKLRRRLSGNHFLRESIIILQK